MSSCSALVEIAYDLSEILDPPKRLRVSQAAAQYYRVETPGRGIDFWNQDLTPYMVEPMDMTASRRHNALVFVGPAQSGKTEALLLGRWCYTVMCHPMDLMIVQSSQETGRDFSRRKVQRMHRHSPLLREKLSVRASDDNTYDKHYRSGIIGNIAWPSNGQLAGRSIPIMLLTDYDRWPADIDGEGSGWQQARKRTQIFGSLAMAVAESSPGSNWLQTQWTAPGPHSHAAPPTVSGARANILALYNAGDRRLWYVPCQACGEYYPQRAAIEAFSWRDDPDPVIAAETAGTVCTHCGIVHPESTKAVENAKGVWLAEGQSIDRFGNVSGRGRNTYPSYWLGGGAAAFQTRQSIVLKYLEALREYEKTGDETGIKAVVNTDIGAPYKSLAAESKVSRAGGTVLQARAEVWTKWHVPGGVRFLVAAVDVQINRFVVQVIGYGERKERWLIDRYNLVKSNRTTAEGKPAAVAPGSYAEDWKLLDALIEKSYPLDDGGGRRMRLLSVGCDSGGAAGVTEKAYDFWRYCKKKGWAKPAGRFSRFYLLKGEGKPGAPRLQERFPDMRARKGRDAGAAGDVPVWFLGANTLKDTLAMDLERTEPGPGYFHFPHWLDSFWYDELTRESRTPKGWANTRRNEAWDLAVYTDALAILASIETINWSSPPGYAAEWDKNSLVFHPSNEDQAKHVQSAGKSVEVPMFL